MNPYEMSVYFFYIFLGPSGYFNPCSMQMFCQTVMRLNLNLWIWCGPKVEDIRPTLLWWERALCIHITWIQHFGSVILGYAYQSTSLGKFLFLGVRISPVFHNNGTGLTSKVTLFKSLMHIPGLIMNYSSPGIIKLFLSVKPLWPKTPLRS